MECVPHVLDERAFLELDRANKTNHHDWFRIFKWLDQGVAQVWKIGPSYVLTFANADDEIEVLLAGGCDAHRCVGPWEKAMIELPQHAGKTLRVEGRKGWRRLLPHWNYENGVLTMKVPNDG